MACSVSEPTMTLSRLLLLLHFLSRLSDCSDLTAGAGQGLGGGAKPTDAPLGPGERKAPTKPRQKRVSHALLGFISRTSRANATLGEQLASAQAAHEEQLASAQAAHEEQLASAHAAHANTRGNYEGRRVYGAESTHEVSCLSSAILVQELEEARCRAPTAAPHKPAEEHNIMYRLPNKFDDMSKARRGVWRGEGTAAEHLSPAWTQETARLVAMGRVITGGKGEIVMSFPAYIHTARGSSSGVVLYFYFLVT